MIDIEKTFSPFAILYFITLVFIGAFFLMNLTLAVIKFSFTQVMDEFRDKPDTE